MQAYSIRYSIRGKETVYNKSIDAKGLKSAKKKIGKKHGYVDGRMIQIIDYKVIGYF